MNEWGIFEKSYGLMMNAFLMFPEIEEVVIFGSRAKGNYRNGSDIDLALKGHACSAMTAVDLSAVLNERLPIPYTFDVVAYNSSCPTALKEHIDRVGKTLFRQGAMQSETAG